MNPAGFTGPTAERSGAWVGDFEFNAPAPQFELPRGTETCRTSGRDCSKFDLGDEPWQLLLKL
jgi:hypothetical protein